MYWKFLSRVTGREVGTTSGERFQSHACLKNLLKLEGLGTCCFGEVRVVCGDREHTGAQGSEKRGFGLAQYQSKNEGCELRCVPGMLLACGLGCRLWLRGLMMLRIFIFSPLPVSSLSTQTA